MINSQYSWCEPVLKLVGTMTGMDAVVKLIFVQTQAYWTALRCLVAVCCACHPIQTRTNTAPLVRCMNEVVIQPKPEDGRVDAQVLLEHRHGWDRAAFSDVQRLLAQHILKHLRSRTSQL